MRTFLFNCVLLGFFQTQVKGASIRVVGGYEAAKTYGRYQVSLQSITGSHVCGGAIISKRHIITAAHCVANVEPEHITVVVGTVDLDDGGTSYSTASLKIHDGFNITTRVNDIAILTTAHTMDLESIDVIDLHPKDLVEGDSVILTGFGSLEANDDSNRRLHVLNLTVFNQETCKYAMRYSKDVHNTMFCTFNMIGQGTCRGDSGSPLMKNNKLVGIVSWGIPCAVGFPDVHTRITSFIPWIKRQIIITI